MPVKFSLGPPGLNKEGRIPRQLRNYPRGLGAKNSKHQHFCDPNTRDRHSAEGLIQDVEQLCEAKGLGKC